MYLSSNDFLGKGGPKIGKTGSHNLIDYVLHDILKQRFNFQVIKYQEY